MLLLIFVAAPAFADHYPTLEGLVSPDQRLSVVLEDSGRLCIEDLQTRREVALIADEFGARNWRVIVRWSPNGSKVAVEVAHDKGNDVFVLVKEDHGFREVRFTPPDVFFAIYRARWPKKYPAGFKTFVNADGVGKWLNNSKLTMVKSYTLADAEDPNGKVFELKGTYILEITDGQARVKDAKLKVAP